MKVRKQQAINMPALRNRQHLIVGASNNNLANGHANGYANSKSPSGKQEKALLKKKLSLLEDQIKEDTNNNNNQSQSDNEEFFGDTHTTEAHFSKFNNSLNDEKIPIFSSNTGETNQSVKDQFAVALLRLQHDLDATNQKLGQVETRLDAINRQVTGFGNKQKGAAGRANKSGLFSKDNMYNLMYLSWPVVVFIAMRAIEKRSLSGSRLA